MRGRTDGRVLMPNDFHPLIYIHTTTYVCIYTHEQGSLTATLMACDVDAHHATEVAVRIMRKYGIYERRLGLVGVRVYVCIDINVWVENRPSPYPLPFSLMYHPPPLIIPIILTNKQVWGPLVRDWLWEILPADAHVRCSGRVHISVLCLPFRRHHVRCV